KPPSPILDGLAALVDKSLVWQKAGLEGEPRFSMLETIREYALELLVSSGEAEHLRQRHANFFLTLAETVEAQLTGMGRAAWRALLESDYAILRAALEWSHAIPEKIDIELRLAGALWWFWYFRSYADEGRRWLEEAIARTPPTTITAT